MSTESAKPDRVEITVSPDALFREIQGESVILDLRSQRYFGLDVVGTRMWELLAEHREPSMVADAILHEFEVERPEVERDLETLIAELEAAELITVKRPELDATDLLT